jgi:4-diphosphocytidyl-2C-methyl-D-erythritol kinase
MNIILACAAALPTLAAVLPMFVSVGTAVANGYGNNLIAETVRNARRRARRQ